MIFNIGMLKLEVISWLRIQEMFRFYSFYKYGIIVSALILRVIGVRLIKMLKMNNFSKSVILCYPNNKRFKAT